LEPQLTPGSAERHKWPVPHSATKTAKNLLERSDTGNGLGERRAARIQDWMGALNTMCVCTGHATADVPIRNQR